VLTGRSAEIAPGSLRYGTAMSSFKDFSMKSITGEQVSFNQFDGKVALIINVASA
jgi:Glutathione peroxidase